jgi:hypothetical protein
VAIYTGAARPRSGRDIAQMVNRWLTTAAAWVRARSGHVGFVVDKVALGRLHNHPGQVQ